MRSPRRDRRGQSVHRLASDTVAAFTSATTAVESFAAAAGTTVVDAFTSAATATEIYIGAAVATLDAFVADAREAGPALITGEAGDTLDVLVSSAFGIEIFIGSFARTIAALFADGDGRVGTSQPIVQLAGTSHPDLCWSRHAAGDHGTRGAAGDTSAWADGRPM